ncbi:MYCBP-associated protein-like isoform X4 [Bolinopsis microptera]|uniref:MYCBP-associated protein-like isoform X4 n=1 Tax=Bolinopsis microptera TaxID=2820187 RepID=UPI003078F31F
MVKGKGGKDRPRSSANKRKKAGSPDGSDIPLEGQLASFENYHQPPIVDVIRGPTVEELTITDHDMIARRPAPLVAPPKELKSVEVRKKRVVSNVPTKTVSVLKKVEARLPEVAVQSAGPRFNPQGEILPYSILGAVDQYQTAKIADGNVEKSKAPRPISVTPSETLEILEETREGKALSNWERQLRAHGRQMDVLASKTGKTPSSLLMNRTSEHRIKQEERTIIDRVIPVMDTGKGFRVGSEFWSQPQQIGEEDNSIVMTLNQSEQGKHPELERIGNPFISEGKQGHMYPWKRSKFFEKRRKELDCVLTEQEPPRPDFSGLFVRGKRELKSAEVSEHDICIPAEESVEKVDTEMLQSPPEEDTRKGPILEINGVESRWGSKTRDPTVVRILFNTDAGVISTQHINLKNTGTTAIFYAWKFLPRENKLNTIMEGNKQRFYFSINDGVILPGEELSIPLIFLSKQAGIYTESWQFITKPILNDGAPIVVTLKGIALKRDIFKAEKAKIEELLEKRQTQYNIKLLVDELVRGVHSPPPPPAPSPPPPDVSERFDKKNPYLHYQSDYYKQAEEMYASLSSTGEEENLYVWDETLLSLRKAILGLPEEEQAEKMAEFSVLREKFTQPRIKPISEDSYDLCYGCLRAAIDSLEDEDLSLRSQMSLPERIHVEEPPPPEIDATSEKTAASESRQGQNRDSSALISPAPDSKKAKKDGDKKKDAKPGSKRTQAESKPRVVSKAGSKKSDQQLIPDDEEAPEKKEWEEISDPVLKKKYQEKLTILTHNILKEYVDHIALALEEQLGKPF